MKGRVSILRMIIIAVGLLLLALLMSPPSASVSASSCKDGYFAVGGYDGSGYGVSGELYVTDPNTVCMWSNQVAIWIDQYNSVEGGWQESPYNFGNSGKHPWTHRVKSGVRDTRLFGQYWLSAGSYPAFKLVSRAVPGTYLWDFYLGGTLLHSWDMGRGDGTVVAQQERWNHADGEVNGEPAGLSHIRALKKANINRQFINWSYLEGQDYDVDYRYVENWWDNTQFWVYSD